MNLNIHKKYYLLFSILKSLLQDEVKVLFFQADQQGKKNVLLFCSVRKHKRLSNDLSVDGKVNTEFEFYNSKLNCRKRTKDMITHILKINDFSSFHSKKIQFVKVSRNEEEPMELDLNLFYLVTRRHCAFKFPTFMILYGTLGLRSLVKNRTKKWWLFHRFVLTIT